MAKTVVVKEIDFTEINWLSILRESKRLVGDKIPTSLQIASLIEAKETLANLEKIIEAAEERFISEDYSEIMKALTKEGVIKEKETPVFNIINKKKQKIASKILTSRTTQSLNMEAFKKAIEDPGVFDRLPAEYKEEKIKGKTFFTSLYKNKELGIYSPYFKIEENTTLSLKDYSKKEE